MNVQQIINLIVKSIKEKNNFFRYNDMILIGENTSGKSNIIKGAIRKLEFKNVYFIDATNRVIPTQNYLISDEFNKVDIEDVVKCRIKTGNFNRKDVFLDDAEGEIVLGELINNNLEYIKLFKDILNINMEYEQIEELVVDEVEQIYINGTNLRQISSGVQSMLRILMEVNFANKNYCNVVFIDEFNSNLDYKTSSEFFKKLKSEYSHIRFIITSHDIYTLRGVNDVDIVRVYKGYENVYENRCEFFDANDLDNLEVIDRKLFSGSVDGNKKDEMDIFLANLLKLTISGMDILKNEIDKLNSINENTLTIRQKMVRSFILERLE